MQGKSALKLDAIKEKKKFSMLLFLSISFLQYYCKSFHTNNYTSLHNKKVDEITAVEEAGIHLPDLLSQPDLNVNPSEQRVLEDNLGL